MPDLTALLDEKALVIIGTGTLTAKMNKGSFVLKDRQHTAKKLPLILKGNTTWTYASGHDTLKIHLSCENPFRKDSSSVTPHSASNGSAAPNDLSVPGASAPDVHSASEISSPPEDFNYLTLTFEASRDINRFTLTLKSHADEHFYGCGEQFTYLDLKGQNVKIWVSEHQNSTKIAKKCIREMIFGVNPDHRAKYSEHQTYIAAPSFLSGDGYFVDCDTDGYAVFSFKKDRTVLKFTELPRKITLVACGRAKKTAKQKTSLQEEKRMELPEKITWDRSFNETEFGKPPEAGKNFYGLMGKISDIAGKSVRLPDWVGNGAILAVQGGEERLLEKLKKAENAGVRVAGIWCQDWSGQIRTKFGTQVCWNWQPDEKMYSKELLNRLHEKGVRFLGYINPYLKRDTPLYNEAVNAGYAIRKQDGTIYHVRSTTFDAAMVDLTNPKAYLWYENIIRENLIGFGLDGWMADFGEYLPVDAVLSADSACGKAAAQRRGNSATEENSAAPGTSVMASGGSAARMHNLWSTLWQKCNRDAINACGRGDDIFTFNRAAYRGTFAHANSCWNGDQHVDWSDEFGLGSVIPATLSLACIGAGICHSDIGGYTTIMHMRRDSELFLRWAEMNVFTPVFRCHEGNRPEENVQFDADSVLADFAKLSVLFAELKPYRDHVLLEYAEAGIPANRPLFFAFDEPWCCRCQTEFLFGNDVLVTPVLRKGTVRKTVRLPEGEWVRFFTGDTYSGGEFQVVTPLGQPVAFYRAESEFSELFSSL